MRIETIEVFPVRMPMKAVLTLPRGPSRTIAEASLAAASASPAWLLSRISKTLTRVLRLNVDTIGVSLTIG